MKTALKNGFLKTFGREPQRYFSAPGRTELGGNHTDHQGGCVLAAAVELDTCCAVAENDLGQIRLYAPGFGMCQVDLNDLMPKKEEYNTTTSLVRGMAAGFAQKGCVLMGLDIYVESTVLPGSGLSSSAAFEVLLGNVFNTLAFAGRLDAVRIAQMAQWAENEYFGKPCGLMDQMASSVGGVVAIDFSGEAPKICKLELDLQKLGYCLCIIDTGADHAQLTGEYAAIPAEMKAVAAFFGQPVLSRVEEKAFYAAIPQLRRQCGDRAVLRALHFFRENLRVRKQTQALQAGDLTEFFRLVKESGRSSYMYLQNVLCPGSCAHQEMAMALAMCETLLEGQGAFRVHGGGFAGTVQAYVPLSHLEAFQGGMEAVFGPGSCHVLQLRQTGGTEL